MIVFTSPHEPTGPDIGKTNAKVEKLNPLEVDTIDIFVRIARLFGVSKSVGKSTGCSSFRRCRSRWITSVRS